MKSFVEFINSIDRIEITNSKTNITTTFSLVHIGNGRFGIDLSQKGKFVNNELIGTIEVVVDNVAITSISAYNAEDKEGFRLFTGNKLVPASSASSDVHTVSSMFMDSEIGSIASGYTLNDIKATRVLGIVPKDNEETGDTDESKPQASWVTGAKEEGGVSALSEQPIATIKVANGTDEPTTYTLHTVTYTGDSDSGVYNLSETFYVLKTSTSNANVLVRNYSAVSLTSKLFRVTFTSGETTSLNLTSKGMKLYSMRANSINVTTTFAEGDIAIAKKVSEGNNAQADAIAIDNKYLIEYKAKNPTEYSYLTTKYVVTISNISVSNISVEVEVEFVLPTNVSSVNYYGNKDTTLNVGDLGFEVGNVESVTGTGVTYNNGDITISASEISNHYNSNDETYYVTLTIKNKGSDITYYIVVNDVRKLYYYANSNSTAVDCGLVTESAKVSEDNDVEIAYENGKITTITFAENDYTDTDGDGKFTKDGIDSYFVLKLN